MYKFFIILILIFSFPTFAEYKQFKPMGSKPNFAPYPFADKTKSKFGGSVTVNGRFAVATFNPRSAAALARQLARKSPYAMLGLAALDYFQNENDEWYAPAEKTGEVLPEYLKQPKLQVSSEIQCNAGIKELGSVVIATLEPTPLEADAACLDIVTEYAQNFSTYNTCGSPTVTPESTATNIVLKVSYPWKNGWGNCTSGYFASATVPVDASVTQEVESKSCPPDEFPSYTVPYSVGADDFKCMTPQDSELYAPKPASTQKMAEALGNTMESDPYADWDWKPFQDRDYDEFLNPESVDSYNQPTVSDQFNDYLKSVSSGNHQSADPNAPNYVPAEFVDPTKAAIKATEKGEPLVDPVTDEVVTPKVEETAPPVTTPTEQTITVNIPEDDTISQTEYEQSNNKFFEDFKAAADPKSQEIESLLQTAKDGDKDFIDSLTPDVLDASFPQLPLIKDLWPNVSTGNCIPFTLNVSIRNEAKSIVFDKHCPPYDLYVNPMLTYFLYIITGLYVLHLAGRTFTRTVS